MRPRLHQNSRQLTKTQIKTIKSVRYVRKFHDGAGLYLCVLPTGTRCWRYRYRFAGKDKSLSLGIYPDVSLETARQRHRFARHLLASGCDPSELKRAPDKSGFIIAAREWSEGAESRYENQS